MGIPLDNSVQLLPGREYSVVKEFIDYDQIVHTPGETWIYEGTNFLPYEDGLTLHVIQDSKQTVYRLQWRAEEQAEIIENFRSYVSPK